MQNLSIGDQQANLNYLQGNFIQDSEHVNWLIKTSLKGGIKNWTSETIILCNELLKVHPKNYPLFMTVNKDFRNFKTNRPELDDLQNTNL